MSAKVTIYDKQKKVKLTADMRKLIRKACSYTLKSESFEGDAQIDVSIVDDEQIKEINSECRSINSATDVLSFPLGENGNYDIDLSTGAYMLGDVVLSAEHAIAQAEAFGHSVEREMAYLTVHSVLHLLGYDHIHSDSEKAVMRRHEEKVMTLLNLER